MGTYIVRRILWGIVLLLAVSAITFIFFNVFPSADPAGCAPGAMPARRSIHYIRHRAGAGQVRATSSSSIYMKNIFLHFNFGYSFYTGASVLEPDPGPAAGHAVADRRRRHHLAD